MLASMETYLLRGERRLRRWLEIPRVRKGLIILLWGSAGFFLSAAALREGSQPLAMGLVCSLSGWRALVVCLGSLAGYSWFWGAGGLPGLAWSALGGAAALCLGKPRLQRNSHC